MLNDPDFKLTYRRALGTFVTGVTVMTAVDSQLSAGLTVNSFTSVSLTPPLVLWCLGDRSDRRTIFSEANTFGINVLGADARDVAERFAWGDWRLRPDDLDESPPGAPRIRGSLTHLACRVRERIVLGDHMIIVGEVETFDTHAGEGLVFFRGGYGRTSCETVST